MLSIKQSFKTGFSFGLTSGVITTLGLMVGLHSGTHSKTVVISGILFIAIADALSDALGIHVSEESRKGRSQREIWESTFATFISKFTIALMFVVPVLFLSLSMAVVAGVLFGLFLIGISSFIIAKGRRQGPYRVVLEHLAVAVLVIVLTHYIGDWIAVLG